MYFYLITFVLALIGFKLYLKLSCGMCNSDASMDKKIVIVTGANSGIGFETAKELARRGARVILACRDIQRGNQARDLIVKSTGNNNVIFKQLDLSSFESIKDFAKDILQTEQAIQVLVNNAGTGKLDNSLTQDNLSVETQVNHFGPFLLTKLLLPLIKSSAPSRIINVSSILHRAGKIDLDTFYKPAKNTFEHMRVYSNTKLANILFTRKLSQELQGTGVTVNCLHPGGVDTEIFKDKSSIARFLIKLYMKTPYEGAQTSIYLAVAPELKEVTGKYFVDCQEAVPSSTAKDDILARKLWDLSDSLVS